MMAILMRAVSLYCLVTVAIGFAIDADYSAFSNLVTTAYIGSPGTPIRVSLGFSSDSSLSFLYDGRTDCPAFVGACYDPEFSATYFSVRQCPPAQNVERWEGCSELTDLVALGTVSAMVYRFRLLSQARISGPQFREVAGMVSLHRRSRLMAGKRLHVFSRYSSSHPGIRIVSYLNESPPPHSVSTVKECDSKWVFEASIPNVVPEGVVRIEFDPNIQRMLIPVDIAHRIDWLEVSTEGEVFVDCEARVDLSLLLHRKRRIRISARQLVNPRRRSPDGQRCEARVLVSPVIDMIVIGRQLIESVDHIVLDNVANRIGFGLLPNLWPSREIRFVDPKPLIPIVGPDVNMSYEQDGQELNIDFFGSGSVHGLFLWKRSPQQYRHFGMDVETVMLVHTDGEASDGPVDPVVYPIQGHWRLESNPLVLSDGIRLMFRAVDASSNLVLRFTKRGARLIMYSADVPATTTIPLEDLNLPDPFITEVRMDACAVCLAEISVGETAQNMPECTHAFHRECIRPWLEGRSQTCPSCRSVVSGL
jgi:hypothetical protein